MSTLMKRRTRLRGDSGAELVELAVVLPLLLILIAGIVDFGFLLQSFEVVSNAAREGARVGVLPGYNTADIQGRVAQYVSTAGLTGTPTTTVTSVTVTPGGGGASFPAVQVSVSYAYQFLFIKPMVTLIGGNFAASKTFTATAVMRTEIAP
jgi:Flp pilus assembly protein TadG